MKVYSRKSMLCLILALALLAGMGAMSANAEEAPGTKLTFWCAMDSKIANNYASYEDLACMKALEEILNIDIEWQHPPVGEEASQFNLIVASQKYPDMIFYDWVNAYPGGPEKALADGVIQPLNDYMEYAPNLQRWFDEIPELKKQCTTDAGTIYMFPTAKEICMYEETLRKNIWMGPIYRADWAEALGIEEPRTLDEVHDMLAAFKEEYDCIPFTSRGLSGGSSGLFYIASSYGVLADFFVDGDQINHGLLTPEFKDYVETMAEWYAEGLIDPDFMAVSKDGLKAKVTNGEAGMFYGTGSGNWQSFASIMATTVPEADLEIMHFPTGPEGKAYTAQWDINLIAPGAGSAISTTCTDIEAAMRFLDYGYSPEGMILENIGIEGVNYYIDENGDMQYTEEFLAQVAEKDLSTVNAMYVMPGSSWSTIEPLIKNELNDRTFPNKDPLADIWGDGVSAALILPPITATAEEADELASIMNQVKTYRDEMISKIIMGQVPFEEYDTVVEQCKAMGLERALEIENAAYERYQSR
ncbi:MAG: extracellular solute-binding protein [Clostridia bacterium]|nr:extracellular solute-binding protein [Clostridia bacterium]